MAAVTYSVVLTFVRDEAGDLVAEEGVEAPNAHTAQRRAQAASLTKAGAIAFNRTGDPMLGEFEDAVVIASFGDVPTDLAGFVGG